MSKFDLRTVGITAGITRMRVAASATRGYVGEPLGTLAPTHTNGVTNKNTVTVLADNDPVIGTDQFRGICAKDFVDANGDVTGTVVAQYTNVEVPIPYATKIRGKAEAAGSVDTQTELTGILGDFAAFGFDATNYTIQTGGESNTYGLEICDGNFSRGTLDVWVDPRAMREAVS